VSTSVGIYIALAFLGFTRRTARAKSRRSLIHDHEGPAQTDVPRFQIQAATRLRPPDWIILTQPLLHTNGALQLDATVIGPHRFYRVIER